MKKKRKKDYSGIILTTFFVLLGIGIFVFVLFPENKEVTKITKKQVEPKVTQTSVPPEILQPTVGANIPNFERFQYTFADELNIKGTVSNLILRIPVPMNDSEKQYVLNNKITVTPTKTYYDGATTFAEYNFPQLSNQTLTISNEGVTNVRTYDLKTAKLINKNPNVEKDLNRYLVAEENIEVDDPLVKSYASKIKGETREEIIQNMYEFIQKHMTYKHLQGVSGAKRALKERAGECSEYSAIMVALCRAKGIPARLVIGHIAREQFTKHNWVEVYFDEYGWVTFDPTARPLVVNVYKNGKLVRQDKKFNIDQIPVKYIATGKNLFSPYWIRYGVPNNANGRVMVKEIISIKKVNS